MSRHTQNSKKAAGVSLVSDQAAPSPNAPLAHQTQGGLFGATQNIFTPAQPPPPSRSDEAGSAITEDLHSQVASLQEQVRVLSQGRPLPHHNPIPRSPTSFLSFIASSSPPALDRSGESFRQSPRGGGSRGGGVQSFSAKGGGAQSSTFSAGDLREIFNPRKPVDEPRLSSLTVIAAVDFLTKWHEHSASVLGTSVPTHLSLLIAPAALQTIADKNDIAPDTILGATNPEIANYIASAVSFGKGPADALLSIASLCSLRRLNSSAFAAFHIRFEIVCFLFGPTFIPEKLLAKAFCSAIHHARAGSHLTSLHLQDWRALAMLLKQAILQREALDPFFGPHKDVEATSRADGFIRNSPLPAAATSPAQPQQHQQREAQSQQQREQRPQQQREPHQSRPSSTVTPAIQRSPQAPFNSSSRFQPRSVAAHAAQASFDVVDQSADDPDPDGESSDGQSAVDE